MKTQHSISIEVQQGYAMWEKEAPMPFGVLSAVAGVTAFVRLPTTIFFVSQFAAGVALFAYWRLARAQRQFLAALCAFLVVGLTMVGVLNAIDLPLPLVLAQGLSILGATAAALFWGGRYVEG
jgi:hypothetical protein